MRRSFCEIFFTILPLFTVAWVSPVEAQTASLVAIDSAKGDLDGDGRPERVVVYEPHSRSRDNGVGREIVVFRNTANGWVKWERSLTAVYRSDEGGVLGDPYEGIEIGNGVLIIYHHGGSSSKWSNTDKYRIRNNRLELIGYTTNWGENGVSFSSVDYNVVTGRCKYEKYIDTKKAGRDTSILVQKEAFVHRLKRPVFFASRAPLKTRFLTPKYRVEVYL